MDCNMPFMDGYEAASQIRAFLLREAGLGVREQAVISAVTGQTEQFYVDKCMESGMNQVLEKPVDLGCLRQLCRERGFII
mmetsp:Transcript_12544/g.21123  ORF Transcript_12544/g.21123 Transcript_12544/m.21123 type:complete len:80 (+) Transcript_12544:3-242(+)